MSRTPPTKKPDRQLVPVKVGADCYGVSAKTIRRYIASGRITGFRFGVKLIRVDLAELDAVLLRPIPTAGTFDVG